MKDILNIECVQCRATKYMHTEWLYQLLQNSFDKTGASSLDVATCLN